MCKKYCPTLYSNLLQKFVKTSWRYSTRHVRQERCTGECPKQDNSCPPPALRVKFWNISLSNLCSFLLLREQEIWLLLYIAMNTVFLGIISYLNRTTSQAINKPTICTSGYCIYFGIPELLCRILSFLEIVSESLVIPNWVIIYQQQPGRREREVYGISIKLGQIEPQGQ